MYVYIYIHINPRDLVPANTKSPRKPSQGRQQGSGKKHECEPNQWRGKHGGDPSR